MVLRAVVSNALGGPGSEASLIVTPGTYNPGTVSVTGTAVTGVGTEFTKTFSPGQSIVTRTGSGVETREINSVTSDTAMVTVSAFAGTNSGATYTNSYSGQLLKIVPSGLLLAMGTTGPSAVNVSDWIYKGNTVTITGTQLFAAFRDRTTYNQSVSATGTLNSIAAGPNINATGTGSFGAVRGFNAFPTVLSTNTGNIASLTGFLSSTQIQSGATGTISNLYGLLFNPTNASTTNTVTNMYGVNIAPVQNGGTLTSYAGVAIAAKPTAATNSALVLIGTTTIPSGNYGVYNSSANDNYVAGNVGIGQTAPTAALHIKAGTTAASSAPLKLTAGTNMTTPEDGAFEFDGVNLYFTVGGVRKTVTLT